MRKKQIKIAVINETRKDQIDKEIRKKFTWYHSGNDGKIYKKGERPYAGVTIVVDNEYANYVLDVIPISDRIIILRLNADLPITIVGIYNYTAKASTEEKESYTNNYKGYTTNINMRDLSIC